MVIHLLETFWWCQGCIQEDLGFNLLLFLFLNFGEFFLSKTLSHKSWLFFLEGKVILIIKLRCLKEKTKLGSSLKLQVFI